MIAGPGAYQRDRGETFSNTEETLYHVGAKAERALLVAWCEVGFGEGLKRAYGAGTDSARAGKVRQLQMYSRAVESRSEWAEYARPAPGRITLMLAAMSFEEQEQINRYAQQLINEAQALVLHLQEGCPMLLYGAVDEEDLYGLERWYRAQFHAMERQPRRWDDKQWVHSHIKQARKWLEEAYVESVN